MCAARHAPFTYGAPHNVALREQLSLHITNDAPHVPQSHEACYNMQNLRLVAVDTTRHINNLSIRDRWIYPPTVGLMDKKKCIPAYARKPAIFSCLPCVWARSQRHTRELAARLPYTHELFRLGECHGADASGINLKMIGGPIGRGL